MTEWPYSGFWDEQRLTERLRADSDRDFHIVHLNADNVERAGMIEADIMMVANFDNVSDIHAVCLIGNEKLVRKIRVAMENVENVTDRGFNGELHALFAVYGEQALFEHDHMLFRLARLGRGAASRHQSK